MQGELAATAAVAEEIIDPALAIIDAHHHLWHLPAQRYLLDEFLEDVGSGHRVEASIYVEAGSFYRPHGPAALRPIGEIEFARGVAAMGESERYGHTQVAAGVVSFADFRLGIGVRDALIAMKAAGADRLVGVRQSGAWDPNPEIAGGRQHAPPELYRQASFRTGFAALDGLGLSFDAFLNHPQLADLTDLARAFPQQRIVLDHCGGLLGVGPYAGRHDAIFVEWRGAMRDLAGCPNIYVKLGGLAITRCGFGFHRLPEPPSSEHLAQVWRPWIETCIELFGAERCMFESNFPVDKRSTDYATLWNAFKRLTMGASNDERARLFRGTAQDFYRLAGT